MNKTILQKKDINIQKYNDIKIKNLEVKSNASETFSCLKNQAIITISESGKYVLESAITASKHVVINIAQNLEVEIYEINHNSQEVALIDMEINVHSNAKVDYLLIDQVKEMYQKREVNIFQNGLFNLKVVGLNYQMSENKINIHLIEKNAQSNFKLITIADAKAHNIYYSEMNNLAVKTKGDIWQKGVVKSKGKNEFLATGFIKKGADDAHNFQESRVLLLDEAATGDASPLLLIDHYNVVAGHAASVSRVNESELYYLQSRGVPKNEAEKLMTIAFIKPLIDEIKDDYWQEKTLQKIENLLT